MVDEYSPGLQRQLTSILTPDIEFEDAPPADKRHVADRRQGERRAASQAAPGDWLQSLTSAERKECPVYGGFMAYFPDAIAAVARHSQAGNKKHNPGQPLHWDRDKSTDQQDCEARHMLGGDLRDPSDGTLHKIGKAWRAMADLQVHIERLHGRGEKV